MTEQSITVAVVIPAGEDGTAVQEVIVVPGTTAQDVLNTLGKGTGFILGTISGKVFKPAELVFSSLTEDEKLVLTPTAEAGAEAPASPQLGGHILHRLVRAFFGLRALTEGHWQQIHEEKATKLARLAASSNQRQLPVTARLSPAVATPAKTLAVKPRVQPAWKEKGWREVNHGVYEGKYRSPYGSYRGRVEFGTGGFRRLYIWGPPVELWRSRHPKAPCFSAEGRDKYQVHMHHAPTSVDGAILNIERILNEVHAMKGKHRG